MPTIRVWSAADFSLGTPDMLNSGVAPVPSVNMAQGCLGVPNQTRSFILGAPGSNVLYRTLSSVTGPLPGMMSQEPLAEASPTTCSTCTSFGPGMVTRGFIDQDVQNGFPIPNTAGPNLNLHNLKVFVLR